MCKVHFCHEKMLLPKSSIWVAEGTSPIFHVIHHKLSVLSLVSPHEITSCHGGLSNMARENDHITISIFLLPFSSMKMNTRQLQNRKEAGRTNKMTKNISWVSRISLSIIEDRLPHFKTSILLGGFPRQNQAPWTDGLADCRPLRRCRSCRPQRWHSQPLRWWKISAKNMDQWIGWRENL